jgi:beta-lactamase regulating signal transducer with metallopeptidase domain
MNVFMAALLLASLSMSAVIALLMLLNRLLAERVPAALRYYMWLVVLLGLLIPFRPTIPLSFQPLQIPAPFVAADTPSAVFAGVQHEAQNGLLLETEMPNAAQPASNATEKSPMPIGSILFGAWIVGALAILSFHFLSYARFIAAIRRWGAEIKDGPRLMLLRALQGKMGLGHKTIAAKTCPFVSSPMLIGFLKPAILLPDKEISEDELSHAFNHELTHFKRMDLWINLSALLATAMHWFNPLVYLMAKAARADCEAACDETVVNGYCLERRKEYGETIIGFIGASRASTPRLSTYFYGVGNSMKKRLFAIMNTTQKSKGMVAACVAAAIAAALLSGNAMALSAEPDKSLRQSQQNSADLQQIDKSKARFIALGAAGLSESQVSKMKVKLDSEDGKMVYEVEFFHGQIEHEYEIDTASGTLLKAVVDYKKTAQKAAKSSASQHIGEARAISIALAAADFSESQVSRMEVKLFDKGKGRATYEVEFDHEHYASEYYIDAVTGEILKSEKELFRPTVFYPLL